MLQPIETIPPLVSGGIMLTYRCSNACKHCLYRCSPAHDDHFMSEEMIDRTFTALSRERQLYGVHLAGGEATLNWDRLLYAVESAGRHGVALDYLETNASWCHDEQTARDGFQQLQRAGLDGVLISASLFHNEFTPLSMTTAAIRAAVEVFGPQGVLVWTTEVLRRMAENLDEQKTHPLRRSCELLGLEPDRGDIWRLHGYLTPGGRAVEKLADGLPRRRAESFAGDACRDVLRGTSHFHIDPFGNLFTGHCPGISVADIDELHPEIDEDSAPVYCLLAQEGPVGVWQSLADDFVPDEAGYVSKCHLCLDVRKHLHATERFEELRPEAFYG